METPPNSPDYSNMSTADLISRIRCLESILRAKNLAEQERLNAMKEFTDYQCNETDDTQTADADNLELSDCICS